jgi:Family of unknown function (DUF6064)
VSDGWTVWLSYRLSDLLMFSPRIYWRLFESLNHAAWPAQPALVAAALVWLARPRRHAAAALAGVAIAWLVVAWAFFLQRYAHINWAAGAFAAAFVLQALGLLALALIGGTHAAKQGARGGTGVALALWALVGHPLLAWTMGRPWWQAEVFALAPDPTVIGTLGLLLLLEATTAPARALLKLLWMLPLLWCLIGAATLWTMGSAQSWVLCAAALLACAAAMRR